MLSMKETTMPDTTLYSTTIQTEYLFSLEYLCNTDHLFGINYLLKID